LNGLGEYITINAQGTFTHWNGWSQIKQYNKIKTVNIRWKKSTASSYGAWKDVTPLLTTNTNGNWQLTGTLDDTFSVTDKYDLQIVVEDLLEGTPVSTTTLSTANGFLWRDLKNKRIGINKKPEKTLDVNGEIQGTKIFANGVDLKAKIDDNKANIDSHANSINKNASNISKNATNISTNAANITKNTNAINNMYIGWDLVHNLNLGSGATYKLNLPAGTFMVEPLLYGYGSEYCGGQFVIPGGSYHYITSTDIKNGGDHGVYIYLDNSGNVSISTYRHCGAAVKGFRIWYLRKP
jgi:hypothetical protein